MTERWNVDGLPVYRIDLDGSAVYYIEVDEDDEAELVTGIFIFPGGKGPACRGEQ